MNTYRSVDEALRQAMALAHRGEFQQAESILLQVLRQMPQHEGALLHLGQLYGISGQYEQALEVFVEILDIHPGQGEALYGAAACAHKLGRLEDARGRYQLLLELRPDFAEGHRQLGIVEGKLNHPAAAIASLRRAVELNPDSGMAWGALADALREDGHIAESIPCYKKALAKDSTAADGHFNLSFSLLATRQFEQGWREYEYRLRSDYWRKNFPFKKLQCPAWQGTSQKVNILLCHDELGFGDTLQFSRFLPRLAECCQELIFKTDPALIPLMELMGIANMRLTGSIDGHQPEAHVPLHSLPEILSLGPDIGLPKPLMQVPVKKNKGAVGTTLKIGLAWAGNPLEARSRDKSVPLEALAPLSDITNVSLHALQPWKPGKGESKCAIQPFPADIVDFLGTARLMAEMDLIISIDCVVAHLAGSLGLPAWVLLGHQPYWCWMDSGDSTPWYPTLQVRRKARGQDWKEFMLAIAAQTRLHFNI